MLATSMRQPSGRLVRRGHFPAIDDGPSTSAARRAGERRSNFGNDGVEPRHVVVRVVAEGVVRRLRRVGVDLGAFEPTVMLASDWW